MTSGPSPHDESPGARPWPHWIEIVMGVALILVGAVVGCLQVKIYSRQADIMEEANKQNALVNRAFISISQGEQSVSVDPSGKPAQLQIFVAFTNSGNTATKDLKIVLKCAASVDDLKEPWPLLHQGEEAADTVPVVVGPHQSPSAGCGFSFDKVQQMTQGKLFGFLLADASYHSRLDPKVPHRTQFAYKLAQIVLQSNPSPTNPVTVLIYSHAVGQHNCADEECPAD